MSESAAKYYDVLAQYYDGATAPENAWTPPKMVAEFCKDLTAPGINILDVGIGTGQAVDFLKGQDQINLHGIDVSAKMIEVCHSKNPSIKLFHGDLLTFAEQASEKFDLIIASGILEFVENLDSSFAILKTLLKPSGKIVFTFEPILTFHKIQSKKKSLVVENTESSLYTEEFYTFRRDISEVNQLLSKYNLVTEESASFVAYRKADMDIVYEIRRVSSAGC